MDNFFTVSEAADKLGLAPKTLRRWEDAGRFTPNRTMGGQRRYSTEDIQILDAIKNDIIPSQSDLLSVEQAANLFGVTPQTIVRWDNEGKIHSLITSASTYYSKSNLSSKIQALKSPTLETSSPQTHLEPPQEVDLNTPIPTPIPSHTPHHYEQPAVPEHNHALIQSSPPDQNPTHTPEHDLPKPFTSFFLPAIIINLILTISIILGYHTLISRQTQQEGDVKGAASVSTAVEEILSSMLDINGNLSVPGRLSTKESLLVTKYLTLSPSLEPTAIPGTIYYDSSSQTLRIYTNNAWQDLASTSLTIDNASAKIGKSSLAKETASERIVDSTIQPDSSVLITFNTDFAPAKKYWTTIENGSFTLHTDFPVGQDTAFTYLIFSSLGLEEDEPNDNSTPSISIEDAIAR